MSDQVEEIEIEDAQDDFVRIADLDKRNVVIFPIKVGEAKGDGDTYPFLEADVIVLDGEPLELLPEVPGVVKKMRFTSAPMIRNGERMLDKAKAAKEVHAKPYSGKINSRKGQKGGRAYGVEAWEKDAPVRALANAEAAKYITARPSLVDDADEFDD
jgi:hypothetical protein